MNTLSPCVPQDKPHYTYVLEYPEDYIDQQLAGTAFYVGKGIGDRIDDHERETRRGEEKNKHKNNVIRKIWRNGYQVAKRILAYFETHEEACMYEIALIFFIDGLTNITYGGEGCLGYTHSEEARRNLSESHKKSPRNAEHVRKLCEANKGKPSWNKGQSPSAETRQKIREARAKQDITDETRHKMSEARKGRIFSAETRQKIREANKGRTLSEEHRQKIRDRQKGQHRGPYTEERGRKISAAKMGHSVSEEARRKISEANKNPSPKIRQKMSESHKGHTPWNKGKPMSEAAKRKLSESQKKRRAQKQDEIQLGFAQISETIDE